MSGLAASGGYYVACLGDSIFADPGTLTGSIGVYAGKMDRSGMYRKIGVNREFITRGENALLFSDEGGFTDGPARTLPGQMDEFYERFLAKVADGRGLTRDEVHAVAQGRVWTGRQGLERGLVDGLGGLHRALDSAKWMLGLDPADKVGRRDLRRGTVPLERMLLKSLREGGGLAQVLGGLRLIRGFAGPAGGPFPVPDAGGCPAPGRNPGRGGTAGRPAGGHDAILDQDALTAVSVNTGPPGTVLDWPGEVVGTGNPRGDPSLSRQLRPLVAEFRSKYH